MGANVETGNCCSENLPHISNNNNTSSVNNYNNINNNNSSSEISMNSSNESMKSKDSMADYPVRSVEVKVCGPLYAELRDKKTLYRDVPEDGILVKIEFADTLNTTDANGKEITCSSPTVLCLHGAPGSHRDFQYMIKHLQQTGHRVIVPNFPTYKLTTKTGLFRHSAREKKEYVKGFLASIAVTQIELLVSHSSAVYPTALLWKDETGPEIKSIAFLNPSGHRRIKAMRPKIVTSVAVRVYRNRLGRGICRTFGTTVLSITGCPVRPDNMDNVILSATTMVYSKFRHLRQSLEDLKSSGIPILMVLSGNDKLVDTEISYEMAEILGASEKSYSVYNQYSVIEKERESSAFPWIVVLPEGGHYSFVHHPKVVNGEIVNFMNRVTASSSAP